MSNRELIQNEPRFRGLVKELDNGGNEVLAYFENEIKKRYDIYEQMATRPGKSATEAVKKEIGNA